MRPVSQNKTSGDAVAALSASLPRMGWCDRATCTRCSAADHARGAPTRWERDERGYRIYSCYPHYMHGSNILFYLSDTLCLLFWFCCGHKYFVLFYNDLLHLQHYISRCRSYPQACNLIHVWRPFKTETVLPLICPLVCRLLAIPCVWTWATLTTQDDRIMVNTDISLLMNPLNINSFFWAKAKMLNGCIMMLLQAWEVISNPKSTCKHTFVSMTFLGGDDKAICKTCSLF